MIYLKRFDHINVVQDGTWASMIKWCEDNLYHGGYYEPNWYAQYPTFYFKDEKEYVLFLLRWS